MFFLTQAATDILRGGLWRLNQRLALKKQLWQHVFIISLAMVSVGLLVYEVSADLLAEQVAFIHAIDLIISLLFLSDFAINWYRSDNRWQYCKSHWTDVLASIPLAFTVTRSLRGLQLLRIVRVIRLLARIHRMAALSEKVLAHSSRYIYVVVTAFVVTLSAALLFFQLEYAINDQLHTFFDAIWWAVVTVTTVGYGDVIPITTAGKVLAMALMIFGVGFMGTMAGLVSHYLIDRR